jgi:hypothetical protein
MKRLREPGELTTQPRAENPLGTDSPSLDLYVSVRLDLTLRPLIIVVNAGLSDEASGVSDDRAKSDVITATLPAEYCWRERSLAQRLGRSAL